MIIRNKRYWFNEWLDGICKGARIDTTPVTARVCGVNIKPISKYNRPKKKHYGTKEVTVWGLFVHVKVENGDQYDLIWELYRTTTDKGGAPRFTLMQRVAKKVFKNTKNDWTYVKATIYPVIPSVLRGFGVHEWVELIDAEIELNIPVMPPSCETGEVGLRHPAWVNFMPADHSTVEKIENKTRITYFAPHYYECHVADDTCRRYLEESALLYDYAFDAGRHINNMWSSV